MTQGVAVFCGRGGAVAEQAGQVPGQAPGRGEQKVARAAGRVHHRELEQGLGGLLAPGGVAAAAAGDPGPGEGVGHYRFERRVEQHLHQAVGRVVAARGLAGVAAGLVSYNFV